MQLEKIEIDGIHNVYALSTVEKEFKKAVNEPWRTSPPYKRYQQKLLENLAVLSEYREQAIMFSQFEKLTNEMNLYSIRHPKATKNVRVLYTITEESDIILLTAFLENNSSDYRNGIKNANKRIKWLYT